MESFEEPLPADVQIDVHPQRGRVVLVMTVELGEGRSDTITVHEHDEPTDLARIFGQKHNLTARLIQALTKTIEANIEELVSEIESASAQEPEGSNIGEVLYNKGRRMQESTKERTLELMQEKEREEGRELTFHPQILSKTAKQRVTSLEDDLLIRSKQAKEALEQKRQEIIKQQTAECTFTPKINEVSQRIVGSKSGPQKFEELYNEARERKARRETTSEEMLRKMYTFKPELITQSPVERNSDIFERLSASKREESKELGTEEKLVDPETKQPLFRPQTGRPPKNDVPCTQRKKDLPISEYLYQCKRQDSIPSEPSHQPTRFSKSKSESLLRKRKREQFRRLFDLLKPQEEQTLRAETMQLAEVADEVVRIIDPLVAELQELGEGLDFEEFASAMENLMERLVPAEKAVILDLGKKGERPKDPSFRVLYSQPTTNSAKSEISRPGQSLYERSLENRRVPST